jgi:dolichyl-phosphooligosaccharide-protein glycotransferase
MKPSFHHINLNSSQFLAYLIIAAIVLALGIAFRLYPVFYNNRIQEQRVSRLVVHANIRNHALRLVESEHPNIDGPAKKELYENIFGELLDKEKVNINRSIKELTKKRQNYNKLYLLGADPYYYLHLTKNLLKLGRLSNTYSNNKFFDPLMLAPVGLWRHVEFHPYTGLFMYKALRFFKNDISLSGAVGIIPVLLFMLSALIFLKICFLFSKDKVVILISGIYFSLSPIYLQRSSIGWYDTDPYIIIFSLAAVFVLLHGLERRGKYLWVALLGALSSVFYLFWQGAKLLPSYILFIFICLILHKIISKKSPMLLFEQALLYILSLLLFLCVLITPGGLIISFFEIIEISKNFLSGSINAWPDMFIMVGELKIPSLQKVSHMLGGYVFIGIAMLGAWLVGTGKTALSRESSIVLTAFLALSLAIAITAERFALLLMPFASLLFVFGVDKINLFLQKKSATMLRKTNISTRTVSYTILFSLLLSPLIYGHATAITQNPVFNPAWESALEKIKLETPENSIIYTWWPPGHFIKAIAERGVSIDGSTFERENSYWIARFLLAETEKEAMGILNMLNSAGNGAVEFLISKGIPLSQSMSLINKLVVSNKKDAAKILERWLDKKDIESFLPLVFSTQNPKYCLLYNEMVENAVGFYFLKHWDFEKASKTKNVDFIRKNTEKYTNRLWSLSKPMPYISGQQYQSYRHGDKIYFGDSILINVINLTAEFRKLEGRITGIPRSIIYEKQGRLEEKILYNSTANISIMLVQNDNNLYSCIVGPSEILKSMLFRLYYLNGAGLEHFKKIIDENRPVFNTRVLVYRVD